mmetsp:Transcript_61262/g.163794  ORF Transcript_61262/g.163794 Transcript_61262/m.163794 type:complete len:255 (-) Transcript_61262:12-776(-)
MDAEGQREHRAVQRRRQGWLPRRAATTPCRQGADVDAAGAELRLQRLHDRRWLRVEPPSDGADASRSDVLRHLRQRQPHRSRDRLHGRRQRQGGSRHRSGPRLTSERNITTSSVAPQVISPLIVDDVLVHGVRRSSRRTLRLRQTLAAAASPKDLAHVLVLALVLGVVPDLDLGAGALGTTGARRRRRRRSACREHSRGCRTSHSGHRAPGALRQDCRANGRLHEVGAAQRSRKSPSRLRHRAQEGTGRHLAVA